MDAGWPVRGSIGWTDGGSIAWSVDWLLDVLGYMEGAAKLFFTSHWKDKRVRHTHTPLPHTFPSPHSCPSCVNICALAGGAHRLCSSAWQSYCCWFLKWPLQYFRLFCRCVINKETLRTKTRLLNDGSANLSGLLLHINASLTDTQMDNVGSTVSAHQRVLAVVFTRPNAAHNCGDSK